MAAMTSNDDNGLNELSVKFSSLSASVPSDDAGRGEELEYVDKRAFDFVLKRLEQVKEDNRLLKQQSEVEKNVLGVSKMLARFSCGLQNIDIGLTGRINALAKPATDAAKASRDWEAFLHENPSLYTLPWRDPSRFGQTVLHLCAFNGNLPACKLLCEQFSFSIFVRDVLGRTPLHLAASRQHLACCEYFTLRAEQLGESAKGECAPMDMAGCTPAALSALASIPQGQDRNEFESKRKTVKRHLHILGDVCISPKPKPSATSKFKGKRSGLRHDGTGAPSLSESSAIPVFGFYLSNGWGVKMEDFVVALPVIPQTNISLFALFDGHGGALCAATCTRLIEDISSEKSLVRTVLTNTIAKNDNDLAILAGKICSQLESQISMLPDFQLRRVDNSGGEAIGRGEQQAHSATYKCLDESGSTCLMALLSPTSVALAYLGDSRAALISKKTDQGKDRAVSRDQTLLSKDQDFVTAETKRILNAGGSTDGNRVSLGKNEFGEVKSSLGMTRALGDFWAKVNDKLPPNAQAVTAEPEYWSEPRQGLSDYFLLLASDGIWDVMNETVVGDFVRGRIASHESASSESSSTYDGDLLTRVACDLCFRCLEPDLDSHDNMSVVIVDLAQPDRRGMFEVSVPVVASPSKTDGVPQDSSALHRRLVFDDGVGRPTSPAVSSNNI